MRWEEPEAAWAETVVAVDWVGAAFLVEEHWLKDQADCWILRLEVGAELWPSSEGSGLVGWGGFLGWAESAQL